MKLKQDIQLSDNFWINEFLSNNDKEGLSEQQKTNVKKLAKDYLQKLRNLIDTGITITENGGGGIRNVKFNKKIGGSSNSNHILGLASDVKFDFSIWNRDSLTKVLQYLGFTNVNFYWTTDRKTWVWIHLDIGKPWNGKEFNYRDLDANTQKEIKL